MSPATLLALPRLHASSSHPEPGADDSNLNLTPEQKQEVEARLANIVRKYGDRLSEEQRQHLRRILSYNETMLAPIRTFPLKNSDAPATVLKLSTGEKVKGAAPKPEGSAN